jgi:hypothetical protein
MTPGLFVTLLAVAVGLMAAVGFDSAAPASCTDARASLANALTDQAEKQYRAILADEPDSECAADGIADVIARRCDEARERVKRGLLAEAEKGYVAVLTQRPDESCGLLGLRVVSERLCKAADRLRRGGATDEAKKLYQELLTKPRSDIECALAGLAKLPKDEQTTKGAK